MENNKKINGDQKVNDGVIIGVAIFFKVISYTLMLVGGILSFFELFVVREEKIYHGLYTEPISVYSSTAIGLFIIGLVILLIAKEIKNNEKKQVSSRK